MRALAVFLMLPAVALAQVPSKFGYQGKLMKSDGTPEAGVVQMTFSLYAASSGGTPLWSEQQSVGLSDGFYSVALGEVAAVPENIFDGTERFLEVSIGGTAMTPRQKVVSVPYSMVARSVAGGKVSASSLEVGGQPVIDSTGKISWDRIKDIPENVSSVSTAAPLTGDGKASNPIGLPAATPSADGYLAKADYAAFAGKLDSVAVAAPLSGSGKANDPVTLAAASATQPGYLTPTDRAAFAGKLDSVAASAPLSGNGTAGSPLSMAPATATTPGYLAAADFKRFDEKLGDVAISAGAAMAVTGSAKSGYSVAAKVGTTSGTVAAGDHTHLGLGNPGLNLLRNPAMLDRDANGIPDFAAKDVDNTNYKFVALNDTDIHAILGGSGTNPGIKLYSVSLRSTVSDPSPTETVSFPTAIPADRAVDVPVTCSVYVRRPDSTGTNGKAKMRCFDKEAELALPSTDQEWHRMVVSTRVTTAATAANALIVWGSGYKTGADMAYMRYALPKVEFGTSPTDWNPFDGLTLDGDWTVNGNATISGNLVVNGSISGNTGINGNLTVTGTTKFTGAHTVTGDSTFTGATTFNGNVTVAAPGIYTGNGSGLTNLPANKLSGVVPYANTQWGGNYMYCSGYGCLWPNPLTGGCSCPSGYSASSASANENIYHSNGGWYFHYFYTCYK